MNYNKHLNVAILEAVDNQLNQGRPSEVRATLEKLMERGDDYDEAKRKIAVVLVEEMYEIMKEQKPFNQKRYIEKLKQL